MSNKHSLGPRCPICRKRFDTPAALNDHQHTLRHFTHRYVEDEEAAARAKLEAYHREKTGGAA